MQYLNADGNGRDAAFHLLHAQHSLPKISLRIFPSNISLFLQGFVFIISKILGSHSFVLFALSIVVVRTVRVVDAWS